MLNKMTYISNVPKTSETETYKYDDINKNDIVHFKIVIDGPFSSDLSASIMFYTYGNASSSYGIYQQTITLPQNQEWECDYTSVGKSMDKSGRSHSDYTEYITISISGTSASSIAVRRLEKEKTENGYNYTYYLYNTITETLTEEVVFGENGLYVNCGDLYDFDWSFNSVNNEFSSWSLDGIQNKKIGVLITDYDTKTPAEIKDEIQQIFDYDIKNNTPGKLYVGECYLRCFITGFKYTKTWKTTRGKFIEGELTISTDSPEWRKDKWVVYDSKSGGDTSVTLKTQSEYELIVKATGPVSAPRLIVGERTVGLSGLSDSYINATGNFYIIANNGRKRVYRVVSSTGAKVNLFMYRYDDNTSSMFAKFQPGTYSISSTCASDASGGHTYYMKFIELRPEPLWEGRAEW